MFALSLLFMLALVGGDLTQANSLDTGHTRETSDRSGPKSFDSGQNWDDPAWDHSSMLFTSFFFLVTMQRLVGVYTVHRCP